MSSSSHEGFITSLSPIVCNNRRSRKYGFLVVIARQLSWSDNVRLYADLRVYGPPCILQLLHLALSLFDIPRGNVMSVRARARGVSARKTFATKLLPRATSRDRGYCALFFWTFLRSEHYSTDPSTIYYIIPHEKFSQTLAVENKIYDLLKNTTFISFTRIIYFILITLLGKTERELLFLNRKNSLRDTTSQTRTFWMSLAFL